MTFNTALFILFAYIKMRGSHRSFEVSSTHVMPPPPNPTQTIDNEYSLIKEGGFSIEGNFDQSPLQSKQQKPTC